jgi:hypothetical protein
MGANRKPLVADSVGETLWAQDLAAGDEFCTAPLGKGRFLHGELPKAVRDPQANVDRIADTITVSYAL